MSTRIEKSEVWIILTYYVLYIFSITFRLLLRYTVAAMESNLYIFLFSNGELFYQVPHSIFIVLNFRSRTKVLQNDIKLDILKLNQYKYTNAVIYQRCTNTFLSYCMCKRFWTNLVSSRCTFAFHSHRITSSR